MESFSPLTLSKFRGPFPEGGDQPPNEHCMIDHILEID
jgi:hypothetical protein